MNKLTNIVYQVKSVKDIVHLKLHLVNMASFETQAKPSNIWLKNNRTFQNNFNSCKHFFRMIQVTGIKVNLFDDVKLSLLRKTYLFIILLICLWTCGFAIWYRFAIETTTTNINSYAMTDQIVEIAIVYIIITRRPINHITSQIWQIGHRQCPHLKVKFWVRFSLVMTLVPMLPVVAMAIRTTIFIIQGQKAIGTNNTLGPADQIYLCLGLPVAKMTANAFCSYFLLHISILKQSYESLNASLNHNNGTIKDKSTFLKKHQQISELAQSFNGIFGPVITIIVANRMLQMVIEINHFFTINPADLRNKIPLTAFHCTMVFQSFSGFMAMVYVGQQLKNHAQRGIDALLEFVLNSPQVEFDDDEEINNCKILQITSLTTAKNVVSPAEITASKLFPVDYSLILAIVSVTFAFISIIPSNIN
ncbi:hypothetical protein CHUAL_001275 [Chamberlinius hualienensis]